MIQFIQNYPLEKDKQIFFPPQLIMSEVHPILREHHIEFETIYWRDVNKDLYREELIKAQEWFEEHGCEENLECMSAIVSYVNAQDLYDLCLQFFGSTIDLDYQEELQRCDREDLDDDPLSFKELN